MPSDRSPEFEPSLEASSIERPLRPRLRDRTGADLPKLTWPPTERPAEQESSEQAPVEQEAVEQEPNEQTQPAPLPPEPAAGSTAGESVLDSSSASSDAAPVDLETPAPDQERHVGAEPSVASVVGEPMLDDEYGVPLLPERPPRPVEVTPEPGAGDTERLPEPETSDSPSTHAGRVGNRWFRVRRRIVGAAAIAVVLGLTYFLITLAQVWLTGRTDDDGPVDAIVVMGAAQYDGRPSPQLAARLDHVVELWPTGVAPLVVVTGGNIPGDRFTEAEASGILDHFIKGGQVTAGGFMQATTSFAQTIASPDRAREMEDAGLRVLDIAASL